MKKKNGVKIIQTAGYNGARTVDKFQTKTRLLESYSLVVSIEKVDVWDLNESYLGFSKLSVKVEFEHEMVHVVKSLEYY